MVQQHGSGLAKFITSFWWQKRKVVKK